MVAAEARADAQLRRREPPPRPQPRAPVVPQQPRRPATPVLPLIPPRLQPRQAVARAAQELAGAANRTGLAVLNTTRLAAEPLAALRLTASRPASVAAPSTAGGREIHATSQTTPSVRSSVLSDVRLPVGTPTRADVPPARRHEVFRAPEPSGSALRAPATTVDKQPEQARSQARLDVSPRSPSAAPRAPVASGSQNQARSTQRDSLVRQWMDRLRVDHDCQHDKWKYRHGGGLCEMCSCRLPRYLFRCNGCEMLACNRCRRNRL